MPKEQRLPVVQALREEGHSIRAIAGAVGVGVGQVHRDLAGVPSGTPVATQGLDGKTYPAKPASPDKSRAALPRARGPPR
jgi:transposase-like protein